jgi:hypothetical protein
VLQAPANGTNVLTKSSKRVHVWPNADDAYIVPEEVPAKYHELLRQTYLVLKVSPVAAAVMCRRLLESILADEVTGLARGRLVDKIEKYVEMEHEPYSIRQGVDAIRNLGNFGAHSSTDMTTGELIGVEREDAEFAWDLVLEAIDHYFVSKQEQAAFLTRVQAMKARAGNTRAPILPPEPEDE